MKKMTKRTKRIFSGMLILAMLLSMTACGGKKAKEEDQKETAQTEDQKGDAGDDGESAMENMVPFHASHYDDKIVVDGKMPETFKLISSSDQEEPEYEFKFGSSALVGPDYVLEFSIGSRDIPFADYKKNRESGDAATFYPLLKKDFQIDGRDSLIYSLSNLGFVVSVDLDDYGSPTSYEMTLLTSGENEFKSDDEKKEFIENDADFNNILNSIKFTIQAAEKKEEPELQPGEPTSTGDGIVSMEDLYKLAKWLKDMDEDYNDKYCTYEFVVDYIGAEGKDHGSSDGTHVFVWRIEDGAPIVAVNFRANEDGKWIRSFYNISAFDFEDIPEDMTVEYPEP